MGRQLVTNGKSVSDVDKGVWLLGKIYVLWSPLHCRRND